MMNPSGYLNASEIKAFTSRALQKGSKHANLLKLLHEYAKYFPMAMIPRSQIRDPKAVRKYMFSPDLDFDAPLNVKKATAVKKSKHCGS